MLPTFEVGKKVVGKGVEPLTSSLADLHSNH